MKNFVLFLFLVFTVCLNAQSNGKYYSDKFYFDNEMEDLCLAFSSPQPPPKGESRLLFEVICPPLEGVQGEENTFYEKTLFQKGTCPTESTTC